jgi:hypothetical protein
MEGNIGMILAKTLIALDSHANQCVLGNSTLVVYDDKKPINIIGYDPKVAPLSMTMVALAYNCPNPGETFILIVN